MSTKLSIVNKQGYQSIYNSTCPVNQYLFQQACLKDCPPFTSKTDNGFIKYCKTLAIDELECPREFCDDKYPYCFEGNCVRSCPEYTVSHNELCLMDCPKDSLFITASCEGVCYTGSKFCSKTCPISHPYIFSSLKLQHCLVECPNYTAIDGKYCRLSCPVENHFLFNQTCLEKCPYTHPMIVIQTSPFNRIFTCMTKCPKDTASYRNVCVSICPKSTFLDSGVQCLERCENSRPFINTSPSEKNSIYYQQCVSSCPLGKYSINKNSAFECVSKCPPYFSLYNGTCLGKCPYTFPLIKLPTIHEKHEPVCVKHCPNNMFKFKFDFNHNLCVEYCPLPHVHFMSNCSSECRKPLPFILLANNTCVATCPAGFVRYNYTCLDKCPEHARFIENRTCVDHCVNRNSLFIVTSIGKTCINSETCDNETMLMKGTTTCITNCPRKTHFISKDVCTYISECPDSHVLQDSNRGYHCKEKCPDVFYKDGRICVIQCPENKFIMNRSCTSTCFGTKPFKHKMDKKIKFNTCLSKCPEGYFMHDNDCLSLESCSKNNFIYFFNSSCYSKCPPGTFNKQNKFACIPISHTGLLMSECLILLNAVFLFIFFYMIFFFKGFTKRLTCTRLKSLIQKLKGYQVYQYCHIIMIPMKSFKNHIETLVYYAVAVGKIIFFTKLNSLYD